MKWGFVLLVLGFVGCSSSSSSNPTTPDGGLGLPDSGGGTDSGGGPTDSGGGGTDAGSDAPSDGEAGVVTVQPFNTGVDNSRMALADDATDTHWTIKDGVGAALTAYVKTDALGYPGYWLAPTTTSKFITPFSDTNDPGTNTTFTYTTTFTLRAGINLSAVSLVVHYAADNSTDGIKLNGVSQTTGGSGSYSAFTDATITSGFVEGVNTLEVTVGNSSGPTGLRVEMDLTAN